MEVVVGMVVPPGRYIRSLSADDTSVGACEKPQHLTFREQRQQRGLHNNGDYYYGDDDDKCECGPVPLSVGAVSDH